MNMSMSTYRIFLQVRLIRRLFKQLLILRVQTSEYLYIIFPGMDFNFRKYSWRDIQNLSTPYDTASILHYGPYAFAKDKRYPTILPKNPNDKMGQRNNFSPVSYCLSLINCLNICKYVYAKSRLQNDILKINRLYNCGGNPSPPPSATPAPVTSPTPGGMNSAQSNPNLFKCISF